MCNGVVKIKHVCQQFRNVIFKYGLNNLPIGLREFPLEACGDTCIMLGKYLYKMVFGKFDYVCGMLGEALHAWLEKDGIIADITVDQFEGIDEEVVVTEHSDFHNKFEIELKCLIDESFVMTIM